MPHRDTVFVLYSSLAITLLQVWLWRYASVKGGVAMLDSIDQATDGLDRLESCDSLTLLFSAARDDWTL